MNSDLDTTLRHLHRIYVELSHHSCPYVTCERRWLDWHNAGFSEDDLRLTLEFVMRTNKKRERQFWIPLRFGSCIGDLERFGDLCGEARADKRARDFKAKHSYSENKASVLRATNRPDAPVIPDGCMSAKDALKQLRESL